MRTAPDFAAAFRARDIGFLFKRLQASIIINFSFILIFYLPVCKIFSRQAAMKEYGIMPYHFLSFLSPVSEAATCQET